MAQMAKVTINWTGFPGAPGFTNLYFRDFSGGNTVDQAMVNGAVSKVDTWLTAWKSRLPTAVVVGVDPTVEAVEETTGELQAFFTGTPAAASAGTGGSTYSAPSGAVVSWYTATVKNGRRIRGRSFMVPLSTSAYDGNGTILDTALTALNTATNAMIDPTGAGDLGVWSRPTAPGATNGSWALVTAFKIPDKAAILTSRR